MDSAQSAPPTAYLLSQACDYIIAVMLPRVHSEEIFAQVLEHVAKGETVASAARRIGVERTAVTNWARRFPEFGRALAKAMEDGADALADETLRIVDGDDLDDEVEMVDLVTKKLALAPRRVKLAAAGGDPVARARLRSEMRLKLLAARVPEKYGNKVLHAGHDGGAIKSATTIDIKGIAAQLRAAAAGRTIEGSATVPLDTSAPRFEADGKMKRRLTGSSDSFNGGDVSNQGDDPQCPHSSTQSETRSAPSPTQSVQDDAQTATSRSNGAGRSACTMPTSDAAALVGVSDATPHHTAPRVAVEPDEAERFEPGARRRGAIRGGPATPRGAESPARDGTGPIVAKPTSTENSSNSSTCFPADSDWSPEDYV